MKRVIVFGGYGVFGGHVSRALAGYGVPLTIAGRDRAQADAFARSLGTDCGACVADVSNPQSCRDTLAGHEIAVNCAGPYQRIGSALLEACLERRCHYLDIADERAYVALVRKHHTQFHEHGLAAVYGCSSLPGISGALTLKARQGTAAAVQRVRVTLFIGNNNPKGHAAVASLLAILGEPIAAPQGTLHGFREREVVSLPPPFGRRGVFTVNSPEYDLFPALLGTSAVAVKVGFELRLATYTFAALAVFGSGFASRMAWLLDWGGRVMRPLGSDGGAVMTELFLADGSVRWAALVGPREGQRMAALPCALAARALATEEVSQPGAFTAYEFLGASVLLDRLVAAGFQLHSGA